MYTYLPPEFELLPLEDDSVFAASPRMSIGGEDYNYDDNTYEW